MTIRGVTGYGLLFCMVTAAVIMASLPGGAPCLAGDNETIIDLWNSVKAPAPAALEAVRLVPRETAFLILDMEERTCNAERRPRCVDSVPAVARFLERARGGGLCILYSLTGKGTRDDILPPLSPVGDVPIVKSSVDKFYNTDLEKILREKGIVTVVIAGTTAEGAVLHTATGAAMRGFRVVVPVDGMSAGSLYAEQYTAWHLLNAPGTRNRAILTRFGMIEF